MEKEMDEGRKRILGVIAAIFACRKLSALDGKPSPARGMAFRDSIDLAEDDAPDRFALAFDEAVVAASAAPVRIG
jgi:hypothetical protein